MTGGCDTVLNQCVSNTYDGMNRLTAVNGSINSFTYTYDRWGNRLSQTATLGSGSSPSGAVNQATNQLSGVAYDAAGNQEADGISHTFTYDAEGNMTAVDNGSTATYIFDASNHRVQAVTSAGTYEYVFDAQGRRISKWQTSNNAGVEGRIYWDRKQIAFRAVNGQTFFEHQSYLGTERLRTNYLGRQRLRKFLSPMETISIKPCRSRMPIRTTASLLVKSTTLSLPRNMLSSASIHPLKVVG